MDGAVSWPTTSDELARWQEVLAAQEPPPWCPSSDLISIGGVFVCFPRGKVGVGNKGDAAWVGSAVTRGGEVIASATVNVVGHVPPCSGPRRWRWAGGCRDRFRELDPALVGACPVGVDLSSSNDQGISNFQRRKATEITISGPKLSDAVQRT